MITLEIQTENMDDMLKVVDCIRHKIGNEIKVIEIKEEEKE